MDNRQNIFANLIKNHRAEASTAYKFEKLAGDASSRSYYRVLDQSLIIMEMQDPGKNSPAEEFSKEKDLTELPFINIQKFLKEQGLPVPEIYAFDKKNNLLLLSDVGQKSLFDQLQENSSIAAKKAYYRQALDYLIEMQQSKSDKNCYAFKRQFDFQLWQWEFEHFVQYCLEERLAKPLAEKEKKAILDVTAKLSLELSQLPLTFCHRDYHAKNLMLNDQQQMAIIDFQDALLGPAHYDLASLLRDSYICFSAGEREELLEYYLQKVAAKNTKKERYYFDLCSLQRNMKAAGRFHYLYQVKGKDTHLPFIKPTLLLIRENMENNQRFSELLKLIGSRLEQLLNNEEKI